MRRTKSVHQPRSTGRLRAFFHNTAHLEFGENGEMNSKVKAIPDGYRGATPFALARPDRQGGLLNGTVIP